MKILRIILLVIGWLCIALNVLYYLTGDPQPMTNSPAGMIAYFIGSSLFTIIGVVLIVLAARIKKKLNQKQKKSLLDTLLEEERVNSN